MNVLNVEKGRKKMNENEMSVLVTKNVLKHNYMNKYMSISHSHTYSAFKMQQLAKHR